jgi:hypothetical protein
MFPEVFTLLHTAEVAALVANRIYRHGTAPLNVGSPYLTWFIVDGIPQNTLADPPPVDRLEVQVDLWSDNTGTGGRQIVVLAAAVRAAIEAAHHVTSFVDDQQDFATQRYRITFTFTIWNDPSS